ncbi:hypothetical protein [Rhizobium sp. YS-1r]|uniref:hypothetical protein n=1 Tax=Rhizobium sp. YS-1r TaxID=1532558 RepID=UPI000B2605A6|nr:hypothetical protein [Rhizobium sp. YS-1r]
MTGKLPANALLAVLCSSCAATGSNGTYEIPNYSYNTGGGCDRGAPAGKLDRPCNVPVLGYHGFVDPTIGVQSGAPGGFGL